MRSLERPAARTARTQRRSPSARDAFAQRLLRWYARHGRHDLPWRAARTPYRVTVSEFMLQQTQVERVVPIFESFVARWPSWQQLADAATADVVRAWKGLGYNARALRLHRLARAVIAHDGGELPRAPEVLAALPGIGPYTARAIAAFAFETDVVALDTNVRRIVHRTQLGLEWPPKVNAATLDALARDLLPRGRAFAFNSALMDLGATLCTARAPKCLLCPLRTGCRAAPVDAARLAERAAANARRRGSQATLRFEATDRYARGRIVDRLRALAGDETIALGQLRRELGPLAAAPDRARFEGLVAALVREGIVERSGRSVRLARS
ncbi:MAG: A/G-specific adenine glycosylase [Vulcanimicrobiaceae bacterium]